METNFDTIKGWLLGFLILITCPPGALLWYALDSGAAWAIMLSAIFATPGLFGLVRVRPEVPRQSGGEVRV